MGVKIEVIGVEKAQKFLKDKNKQTEENVSTGISKAAFMVQNEVKESIAGRRQEPTSVDTGRFLNSVDLEAAKDEAIVFTDIEYAKFLEYGTSRQEPRRHFENTKNRNKEKIIEIIKGEVKNI